MRIFMDDRFSVNTFYSHTIKLSAFVLVFSMLTLNNTYAGTGDEKKGEKTNPVTPKKVTDLTGSEIIVPIKNQEIKTKNEGSILSYHQPSLLEKEVLSEGEDQNAIITFNVIQYFFQRFKFSEEVY